MLRLAKLLKNIIQGLTEIAKPVLKAIGIVVCIQLVFMLGQDTARHDPIEGRVCKVNETTIANPKNTIDLARVVKRLHGVLDGSSKRIPVGVKKSPTVNAFATGSGQVYVTTGMLKFVKSEDELALVLTHEFAHHMLGHTSGGYKLDKNVFMTSPYREEMSDILGSQLAKMAGYNPCAGVDLWTRMRDRSGLDINASTTHPNYGARIEVFKRICVGNLK